jgi:hypothetical protein
VAFTHFIIEGLDGLIAESICEVNKCRIVKGQVYGIAVKIKVYFLKLLGQGPRR